MPEAKTLFSAQVVLAPHADLGAPETRAERASLAFQALGFTVGPYVGDSFSIEGRAADFKAAFGVRLGHRADGGVLVDGQPAPQQGLALSKLPTSLQALLSAVVFSEPPAFGPGAV